MMKKISVWTLCALLLAGCATNEKITGSGLLQSKWMVKRLICMYFAMLTTWKYV